MSHLSIFMNFMETENVVFNLKIEIESIFLCEDGIKKSVPHSHRWSSLGKRCDAKQ